ncbi:MAG: chloride channel protein [Bacteroidales bacterium]
MDSHVKLVNDGQNSLTFAFFLKHVREVPKTGVVVGAQGQPAQVDPGVESGDRVVVWSAAILLKSLAHFVEHRAKSMLLGENHSEMIYLLPLLGIGITFVFVNYVLKQDIGHGISKILFSISKRKGHLKPHNTWSSMIASSFTVGLGGSVGLEAPIVLTGSSIGSTIGNLLRLNYKTVVLLVGAALPVPSPGFLKHPLPRCCFHLKS